MPDLRDALDREGMHFDLAPGALDRLFERRRRRQRRAKVVTTAVTVAIVLGVVLAFASLRDLGGTTQIPVQQPTTPASQAPPVTPLEGTWQSVPLGRAQIVRAFVGAGGTATVGRAFFAQLGGRATRDAVVTLRFQDGAFVEFESGDGNAPVTGYEATYQVSGDQVTIESPRCTGTYTFAVDAHALRLRVIHQCDRHDGVYNTTLFTSWPLFRQG